MPSRAVWEVDMVKSCMGGGSGWRLCGGECRERSGEGGSYARDEASYCVDCALPNCI